MPLGQSLLKSFGAAALLAADFQRVKIIDGQGAFPRIQGDVPAADRYTEMRLSPTGCRADL